MEAERQRDFLEIEKAVESRLKYIDTFNYTEDELRQRKEELSIVLKKLNKIRYYRLNPLETIETVRGIKFKIGDYFHIPGDELTKYKIIQFPDSVTIRGEANNPAIGKPWIVEVYVETARKIKVEKTKRIKEEKKRKKVKIESGEYFATYTNNTVYKAISITNKTVKGINKLTAKNAPKQIETSLRDIIIKTKKDYKKQHKAEKNHG